MEETLLVIDVSGVLTTWVSSSVPHINPRISFLTRSSGQGICSEKPALLLLESTSLRCPIFGVKHSKASFIAKMEISFTEPNNTKNNKVTVNVHHIFIFRKKSHIAYSNLIWATKCLTHLSFSRRERSPRHRCDSIQKLLTVWQLL